MYYACVSTFHLYVIYPNKITIETNASDYTIARILSISCPDGELHLVTFYSQTLTAPELNYDTHDKELLAIFKAFKSW